MGWDTSSICPRFWLSLRQPLALSLKQKFGGNPRGGGRAGLVPNCHQDSPAMAIGLHGLDQFGGQRWHCGLG